jgi:hypothetical protein
LIHPAFAGTFGTSINDYFKPKTTVIDLLDSDDDESVNEPPTCKRTKSNHDSEDDTDSFAKYDDMLNSLEMEFLLRVPHFDKVLDYAKQCLRKIKAGSHNVILQLKCPVPKKNAAGETISLALGGNIPDDKRRSICTVRCADELFGGKENLEKYFIFNLRVECCIDEKSGRCAVCSPVEAQALGAVYEVLCQYAFAIGAKMSFISIAGTTSGIESTLGKLYLENKRHPDDTPYFVKYLPSGYHLSLLAYYCPFMGTVEEQVRSKLSF